MTADLEVRWRTDQLVGAVVRDLSGIFDVRWTRSSGWSCSCGSSGCQHVETVQGVVGR